MSQKVPIVMDLIHTPRKLIDQSISINMFWKLALVFTLGLILRENEKSRA